jgi:hypothetical protein
MRNLVVVFGDQLDGDSAALAGFDPARDAVWMCEAPAEATYAWSHKARIVMFLSAMRHVRDALRERGFEVPYGATGQHPHATLADALHAQLVSNPPQRVIAVPPGEWRLEQDLRRVCNAAGAPLVLREDTHFLCRSDDFAQWMARRTQPRMEHFYRWMRQRSGILMRDDAPEGGAWNYDHDNRASFGRAGPGFAAGATTRVRARCDHARGDRSRRARYADHPGEPRRVRLAGDAREDALEGARGFHRASPAGVRAIPGRDVDRRTLALPRAHVGGDEPEAAASARNVIDAAEAAYGAGRVRRSQRPKASSARSSAGANTCAGCTGIACRVSRSTTRSMHMRRCRRSTGPATPTMRCLREDHRPDAALRLRPPHPAADGDGPVRAAARRRPREVHAGISRSTSTRWSGSSCRTRSA